MVLNDIFTYLRAQGNDLVIQRSLESILEEIRMFKINNNGESPKILINLRTFVDYYFNNSSDNIIYGTRYNEIRTDFEKILESMKSAGATLFFASKGAPNALNMNFLEKRIQYGLKFIAEATSSEKPKYNYNARKFGPKMLRNWLFPLVQTAQKYGEFQENDCFTRVSTAGHIQAANNGNYFIIFGNEPAYITRDDTWKFICYNVSIRPQYHNISFEEYDKPKILEHLGFQTYEQWQLLSIFAGRFYADVETKKVLTRLFDNGGTSDFSRILAFMEKFAPIEKFPLEQETIDNILIAIFGHATDNLRDIFISSYRHDAYLFNDAVTRFNDNEVNSLLRNNPFSSLAEGILNSINRIIHSDFLDASLKDMKTLKELTVSWIERFAGILLKNVEEPKKFTLSYLSRETNQAAIVEFSPEYPDFEIPNLKEIISGELTNDLKYEILSFLIGDIIKKEDLKNIPTEHMMNVIICIHMLKNDSMTLIELKAMTMTILSDGNGRKQRPKKTNARAFRVGILYETLYSILVMCLSPIGMNEFISDLKHDGMKFQNTLENIIGWSRGGDTNENVDTFQYIMKLIQGGA